MNKLTQFLVLGLMAYYGSQLRVSGACLTCEESVFWGALPTNSCTTSQNTDNPCNGSGSPPPTAGCFKCGGSQNSDQATCDNCTPNSGGGRHPYGNGPDPNDPSNFYDYNDPNPFLSSDSFETAVGMARWTVTEPYIDLWLYDEPLGYFPGIGPTVALRLSYNQRSTNSPSLAFFNTGPFWDCSWRTYVEDTDPGNNAATLFLPSGGARYYTNGVAYYYGSTRLQRTVVGGVCVGFTLTYSDGASDVFNAPVSASPSIYLLTARINSEGKMLQLSYQTTNSVVQLASITDGDGQVTTLDYTNALDYSKITSVTDPFNRTAYFKYDSSDPSQLLLTNITDVIGLSSGFEYDGNGWITKLITPYGNTLFEHSDPSGGYLSGDNIVNRSILITSPDSGQELYLYRDRSEYLDSTHTTPFLPASYTNGIGNAQVPTNSPIGTLDNIGMSARNSFHWTKRQYLSLSTTNISDFTTNDYNKATLKHWLLRAGYTNNPTVAHTLSMMREGCPDVGGATYGQMTWYDYYGKDTNITFVEGTNSAIGSISRVIPDGTTLHKWFLRNFFGNVTNEISTYSSPAGIALRTNQFVYATNGYDLIALIGARGELVNQFAYSASHQVTLFTNAVGEVTEYTYDPQGRLIRTKSPAGLTTTNIYFSSGDYSNFVSQRIDLEISRTNSFVYTNALILAKTDERGLTMTNHYDNLQRLVSAQYPDGIISNAYYRLDLIAHYGKLGNSNTFGYDALRRLVAKTNENRAVTLYSYCTCGALDYVQDALHNYTHFYYDNLGRLTNAVYPDGASITNRYDLTGRLTNSSDAVGVSVTNWYNQQGLIYAVSNAFGQVEFKKFDIEDRLTNGIDRNGVSITNILDDLGRLLTRTYPDGGAENFGYSPRGLTAYTNQIAKETYYGYNEAGWKTFETNANSEITQFQYDSSGNLTNLIDGNLHHVGWIYDLYGRVTNKVDDLSAVMFVYGYDVEGRLTNRWTPEKGSTVYKYDAVGNLTNVVYPVSPALVFSYDPMNRLTNMTDAVGTTKFTYTPGGLLKSEDGPWASDTITYSYQSNRLRSSLSLIQPNASAWNESYGYDRANRLTNVTSGAGAFVYSYASVGGFASPSGLVKKLLMPSGAFVTNIFDNVGRILTNALENSSEAILDGYGYGYDTANRRTNMIRMGINFTNSVGYSYDNIGQLKTAVGSDPNAPRGPKKNENFTYAYDAAGNLTNRTNQRLTNSFAVNSLNELATHGRTGNLTVGGNITGTASLVTVNGSAVDNIYTDGTFETGSGTLVNGNNTFTAVASDSYGRSATNSVTAYLPTNVVFQYDANGNLTNDSNRIFEYDDENQLIRVWSTNKWKSEFTYDGARRRRIRKDFTWRSGWAVTNEVRYVFDSTLVIQERNVDNVPLVTYSRGTDLDGNTENAGGIGGLLARTDNPPASHAYYHSDANGNITGLIDSLQNVVARYSYDCFGNTLASSGVLAEKNLYRFSSQETDTSRGLVHYLYRDYDPNIQRWINRDPIAEGGGINFYVFTDNDPVNGVDLAGLAPGGGGPYHPPDNVSVSCDKSDSCKEIAAKMALLMRMINSHTGWDRNAPPGRGGGRHAIEIADLWRAYAKCQSLLNDCGKKTPCPKPVPEPVPVPKPNPQQTQRIITVTVGGIVVIIVVIIFAPVGA